MKDNDEYKERKSNHAVSHGIKEKRTMMKTKKWQTIMTLIKAHRFPKKYN